MFVLIENGELYDPTPRGIQSILIVNDTIERIGDIDRRAIDALGVEHEYIDATGCVVVPGFIDPHAHLLGGSGEDGPGMATPELFVDEIARAGITTIVGLLGVDTTMKTLPGLLSRVKSLNELGLCSRMWSGGYNVPPTTVMGTIRADMVFIDEVVGAGEVAISDHRGLNQSPQELAKLVRDTHVGGMLSGKAGITHFHVGEEPTRLQPLRDLVEDFHVKPEWLYPTHIHRSRKLLDEAIELANAGAYVDMDVVEEDVHKHVPYYVDNGGPIERLTISSDMDSSTPDIFYSQFCELVTHHGQPLEVMLPLVTSNTAKALKLSKKGKLAVGMDGDALVLGKGSLDIREVVACGKVMVRQGQPVVREKWMAESKRVWSLVGDKRPNR